MSIIKSLFALLLSLLLFGCNQQTSGAVDVHWDRDSCERCRMLLSDRYFSAQVRYSDAQQRSQVKLFDDIGCAVIWLKDKPWSDASNTEIWVTEEGSGRWLNAHRAYYRQGARSPMGYGLAAVTTATTDTLDYHAAVAHIFSREAEYANHSTHAVGMK
ncbi:MAG: hypothetical protein HQL48_08330 [Gammaproteobacteria bacterium]|nr:hypothetical protein [Gammaproteobacteria bacterium]